MESRKTAVLVPLLHAAIAGDEASLETLLTRIHPAIVGYARRRLRVVREAEDVAQDIAQEVLIRVAQNIGDCRATTDAQIHAWYLTITRHLVIDLLRGPRNRRERDLYDSLEAHEDPASLLTREESSPEWMIGMAILDGAQQQLRPDTQDLLYARLVESAGWSELAERLGTTPGGVKRRFQRATSRLRREVDRQVLQYTPGQRKALRRVLHYPCP